MHSQLNSSALRRNEAKIEKWPLTSEQKDQWLLEQLYPDNSTPNLVCLYKLKGSFNFEALEKSLNEIVRRHDVLRAGFPLVEEEPVQVIRAYEPVRLNVLDISHLSETNREEEQDKYLHVMTQTSFDLTSDRLFRVGLLKCSAKEYLFVAAFHPIVFDGWSRQLFQRELKQHYKHFAENMPETLPPLPLQYTAYAGKQEPALSHELLESDMAFWRKQLGGELPELNLPFDYTKSARASIISGEYSIVIQDRSLAAVQAFCRQEQTTTFLLFLTVLNVMLHRYTGQEDLLVGCPVFGRKEEELKPMLGLFEKTLVVRTQLSEDMPARAALQLVQHIFRTSSQHQHVPFNRLVSELAPTRSSQPFFQVRMNRIDLTNKQDNLHIQGLHWEEFPCDSSTVTADLTLKMIERHGELHCSFVYNKDLFKPETVARMAGHFNVLLHSFIEQPEQAISLLPILPEDEKNKMLYTWNAATRAVPPQSSIHELFEARVLQHPDRIALSCGSTHITYDELNRRANRIAAYLRQMKLPNEGLVGMYLDRSPEAVAAILGIMKAGGAYVPIDSSYPAERVAFMLQDAKVHSFITISRLAKQLPQLETNILELDLDEKKLLAQPDANLPSISGPHSLAYVLYTSGSTGKPKGVAVPHLGMVRLVLDSGFLDMGHDETFLHVTSLSFDPSGLEIYGALLHGGRLAIVSANQPTLKHIAETIRDQGVTLYTSNPDMVNLLIEDYSEYMQGLKQVLSGGDILPVWLARKFQTRLPNTQFINVYGPTENSVITTAYAIPAITDEVSISIGQPIANDEVYILDKHLQPVPIGVVGELYLGGDGVARCYLHNEAMSKEKFIPNPFSSVPGRMLYKTGDLARFRADQSVDFLGRMDYQVKIRGCRIELGEVEVVLNAFPGVQMAIASAWKGETGGQKLVAYIVMQEGVQLDQQHLRSFVQERLPQYMVPTFIVEMDQIPMTSVGKIDRKKLPSPVVTAAGAATVAPRNSVERKLAAIWERLLKVSSISVQDDFFDLGGHSLLAMQLFSEIDTAFNKKLPVSIIFHENTIEKQASLLLAGDPDKEAASSVVAIQRSGSKPPIFCIHELSGEVLLYWNLAQRLGSDQPVYGLRYATPDDASKITTEDLAARYIRDIKQIQPEGPYYLLGFSLGGLIAYEMAQQLHNMQEDVPLLAILDARNPTSYPSSKHDIVKRIKDNMRIFFKIPHGRKARFMAEKVRNALKPQDLLFNSPGPEAEKRARSFLRLPRIYATQPYPGKIAFFRAQHDYSNYILDAKNGWESTGDGEIHVHNIPSDHATMLNEPCAGYIAEALKTYL
ncbi:non-ribosomal peptide synthetase [Paenibacillus ferrarius]|uniref:non-ribosomal peptide synthetase n=1 Tax=Paenibacillus ferrarius TaxID=1469647 RepID=UPI003D26C88C